MKVTLVYPGIAQIGFDSLGKGTPNTHLVGLGLASLGASIKEKTSHTVDLIDLREMKSWSHFSETLDSRKCDLVGLYVNTVNYTFALKCAEIAKGLHKRVIGGGPHATIAPTDLLDTGLFDHVVTGEGEITFPKILDEIESGKEVDRMVQGETVTDLDELPIPDRDLYNMKAILGSSGISPYPHRYIGILTSRGCPFNCAFCQPLEKILFGRKVRQRSVPNVMREVEFVRDRYKANFIMFQDSVLTIRKEWVQDLCQQMGQTGILWGCQTRVDAVDEDTIRAMKHGGCAVIMFGFESGSDRILKVLGKNTTKEQALEAARLCKKYGIMVFANYMLGVPTETTEDLEATLDLLKKIKPEIHAQSCFSPIPGSYLYDYCKGRDLIVADGYEAFARSAFERKIKGIDYAALGPMRKRMESWKTPWYRHRTYTRCMLSRWNALLREGFFFQTVKEVLLSIPVIERPLKMAAQALKGRPG